MAPRARLGKIRDKPQSFVIGMCVCNPALPSLSCPGGLTRWIHGTSWRFGRIMHSRMRRRLLRRPAEKFVQVLEELTGGVAMTPIAKVARGVIVRDHRDVDEHAENTWPCRMVSLPDAHVHVVEFTAALQVRVMPVVRGVGNGDRGRLVNPYIRVLVWLIDAVVDGLGDGGKL